MQPFQFQYKAVLKQREVIEQGKPPLLVLKQEAEAA